MLFLKTVLRKQHVEVVNICNNLYLGNFKSAIDKKTLIDNNIKAILNVSTFNYHIDCSKLSIDYEHIPFNDSIDECLINYVPNAVAYIKEHVDEKENVLVHCVQGISRSPSILMAYLIIYEELNVYDAYTKIKTMRPKIKPNKSFLTSLFDLHSILSSNTPHTHYNQNVKC